MGFRLEFSLLFAFNKVVADILDALASSLFSFRQECVSFFDRLCHGEFLGGTSSSSADLIVLDRSCNASA